MAFVIAYVAALISKETAVQHVGSSLEILLCVCAAVTAGYACR